MTVLELRFPAGRFHATPWGRHVNEGALEWPPSPWRIVRALLATWYLKAQTEISPEVVRELLLSLAGALPDFAIPSHVTLGHTRHFMPGNEPKHKENKQDVFGPAKTKVFDTFIQLSADQPVLIAWDVTLPPGQLAALHTLAGRLGYFGRAESLVEARVREDIAQITANALPLGYGEDVSASQELVRLLSPLPAARYETWRADFLAKTAPPAEASKKTTGKKVAPKKAKAPEVPADLFAALHADTGDLQAAGWNLPPGAALVNYTRPADAFAPAPRQRKPSIGALPIVARYAVVSAVSPRLTATVSVANRVHEALCKWSDQSSGPASVFTGLDAGGKPLAGHRHAHIFCEANGPGDAITHITVWSGMGFDEQACRALRRLNKVWGHGGHDLRLVLMGLGQPDAFPDCKLFGPSRVWHSFTPFVPTRHAKTFRDRRPKMDEANGWQIGCAGHDLLRLLSLNPQMVGATIRQDRVITVREPPDVRTLRCLQFQTIRHDRGGRRGHGEGGSFTITFPKEVIGPVAFGYGAHFGLGLFVPILESGAAQSNEGDSDASSRNRSQL